jgi:CheY-like chemotaxis protein
LTPPTPPILYAEDDENDAFFMRHAFTRAGLSHRLVVVPDGQHAIHYLNGSEFYGDREAHPLPALVLLDLNLPARNGFEVLEWIRQQPPFLKLPVVIFSSSNHHRDLDRARALGADEYWVKPADTARRIEIVRSLEERWLRGRRPPAPAVEQ